MSAFTRVFDALWLLRSGALQSRGRNDGSVRNGPGSAERPKNAAPRPGHGTYRCSLTPSITTVAAELEPGTLESRISRRTVPLIQTSRFSL